MADIISMSLNPDLRSELDLISKEMGFSGRSDVLRAGLRMLIEDHRQKKKLSGKVDAALLVMHAEQHSTSVSSLEHKYQAITKTQVHNVLANGKCLEIFILSGDATEVHKMADEFQANKDMIMVKLIAS